MPALSGKPHDIARARAAAAQLVTRHYVAAVLSLRATRALDAARILTTGCAACIADAVLRRAACDVPSVLALHYATPAAQPQQLSQRMLAHGSQHTSSPPATDCAPLARRCRKRGAMLSASSCS